MFWFIGTCAMKKRVTCQATTCGNMAVVRAVRSRSPVIYGFKLRRESQTQTAGLRLETGPRA